MAARRFLVAGVLIVSALAQDATPTITFTASGSETPVSDTITAAPSSSTTTPASASSSSEDVPMELWGIANSLLSSYYPSSSITQVASLTWPASVVIGSSTHSVHSVSTDSSTSVASLSTSLSNNKPAATTDAGEVPKEGPKKQSSDKKLGVALGVVFGLLALAIVGVVLFCVHRRHKRHGGAGLGRRGPSVSDSEIGQWREPRLPEMGTVATATGPLSHTDHERPPREWLDRYNRYSHQRTPPAHLHPAFAYHNNGGMTPAAEDNPFFTPAERSTLPLGHYHDSSDSSNYHEAIEYQTNYPDTSYHGAAGAFPDDPRRSSSSHRRSISSARGDRNSRPPTPFSPMLMMQASSKPRQNPFASPEDDDIVAREAMARQEAEEEHDVVSPILPAKSPQRRHSPMVHYPSWSEVSEFDFSGESEGTSGRGRSIRDRSSASSGDDGWRRERESIVGRTELA